MPEKQVPFRAATAFNENGGYVNPVHVVEDARTGEVFTVHEKKGSVREADENDGRTTGKKYEFDELSFLYRNFMKKK